MNPEDDTAHAGGDAATESSSPDSGADRVGEVTTGAKVTAVPAVPSVDEILEAHKERRTLRRRLSYMLGAISASFFCVLLYRLCTVLSPESMAVLLHGDGGHNNLALTGIVFAILATVSLSTMLALVRISSDPTPKDDQKPMVTSAVYELGKAFADGVKTFRS